ncbi:MAG: type II secretion system protein [Campylobacterales bacterium]|nr:type II secretion system protein [Campylobacterales bacterium]
MKRLAFTMIELIFAIVIIGITVVSLPMMMQVNTKATDASVGQEFIFAASSILLSAMTSKWDEHSINPFAAGEHLERVVLISSPGSDRFANLDANPTYRIGHLQQNGHRAFHADPTFRNLGISGTITGALIATSNTAAKGQEKTNQSLTHDAGPVDTVDDNKKMDTHTLTVLFIADPDDDLSTPYEFLSSGSTTPSNMKIFNVTMNDKEGNEAIVLRGYAANIGEFDYYYRTY